MSSLVDDPSEPLYDLPPAEFTAARDALAKQLRADKQRDEAVRVKALRRPSVPAWVVNQVARRHPELVEELVAAGAALATAQRRALSGIKDSGMRAAGQQRREAVERAWATAEEILREGGSEPGLHRQAVTDTLEAVAADEEAAEAVRGGRLATALPPPSGFGDVFGLGLVATAEPAAAEPAPGKDEEPAGAPAGPGEAQRAARRAAEDARRRAEQAAEEADRSQRAGGDARQSAVRAAAEAQRLAERAAAARARADELAAKAADAEARAAAARAHADELAALAEQAAADV